MQYLVEMKNNPTVAAAIGLWGAAMLTFISRDIPHNIWRLIKRQFTTELEVTSSENEFVAITRWVERRPFSRKVRTLRARNREISVGFGKHYFVHNFKLCWFQRGRVETKDGTEMEELSISCFGRNQKFLREIVSEAVRDTHLSKETKIYVPGWQSWRLLTCQSPRTLESIILEEDNKKKLIRHLEHFFNSEQTYKMRGLPYRTGICLYGAPGTGKTSLVRAICAKFNLRLYIVDLANTNDQQLMELLWKVGPRSLVLMEDIDTIYVGQERKKKKQHDEHPDRVTLSGLLNAIDGVVESEGRVLAFTTNYLDKIDSALLRPGRIDLKIELNPMGPELLKSALKKLIPSIEIKDHYNWRDGITPAELQQIILRHENDEDKIVQCLIN